MASTIRTEGVLVTLVSAMTLLLGAACSEQVVVATDQEEQDAPAVDDSDPSEEVDDFCAALEALAQTDGTTEPEIAVEAFDAVRRTAPAEVRDDVRVVSERVIANNYPEWADASMEPPTPEEEEAARERVRTFVDEHCDLAN